MTLSALRPTQETIDLVAGLRGKWHGSYAMCLCPAHADKTPSLSIRQGEFGILVHCFAGCDRHDILRHLRQIRSVPNSAAPRHIVPAKSGNPQRLWNEARNIQGSLAQTYLECRNLSINLPDIRFHPQCPWGRKPNTVFKPALLVALRDNQKLLAIQRIFLDPDTGFHSGKYMLGQPASGAWRQGEPDQVLAIAEGFEDAAAFTAIHKIPCWAALGAERLPLLELPVSLKRLIIAEDNNQPGRLAAHKAIEAYRRAGLEIIRMSPRLGIDWAAANEVRRPQGKP